MPEAKTKRTGASVAEYLASRASAEQLADCKALIAMLKRVTGEQPKMWGPSIVGFGSYRYPLASGKLGESAPAAFAVRGRDLVLYVMMEGERQAALLSKLGPHKRGKVCLYVKRLADLDEKVLEKLVAGSVAECTRLYGKYSRD